MKKVSREGAKYAKVAKKSDRGRQAVPLGVGLALPSRRDRHSIGELIYETDRSARFLKDRRTSRGRVAFGPAQSACPLGNTHAVPE
jgi:hypothetical protein